MLRLIVALNIPRQIPNAITYAQSILLALKGNPAFPAPDPSIATFEADIAALEASHVRTLTRARGTVAERNARLIAVRNDLDRLRTYVQILAGESAQEGEVLIASAGMSVKGSSGHTKPAFKVIQTHHPGEAHLVAKAARSRASYDWQWSKDGTLWIDVERSVRADALVSGLEAGVPYLFRYRVLTKEGLGEWCDPLSFTLR
jgi:hypothetical protein